MGLRRRSFKETLINTTLNKVWHALYVSSRQEKKVTETLCYKGIEAYVPLVKTVRQWSDRKKKVEFPLINGYVFVYVNQQEYEIIYNTQGVVNFVRADKKIAIIRDFEIERLKQLVDLGYQMEAQVITQQYKKGDKVKIMGGPLMGMEGSITETKHEKHLYVLLESIGQCIKVKLPKELACPVEDSVYI